MGTSTNTSTGTLSGRYYRGIKRMKTIIAGSREITDFKVIQEAVEKSAFTVTEVVSGRARGVDKLGEHWASLNEIDITPFPADWARYGRGAGFKRNVEMSEYADALIAVWDGKSMGTKHMIDQAKLKLLKVFVYIVEDEE